MILLVLAIGALLWKRGKMRFSVFRNNKLGKALLFFFLCETICFIAHINDNDSVKEYIGILLENLMLLIILTNIVDSKKTLDKCLQVLTASAGFVFIFAMAEPILNVNLPILLLDTGSRENMLIGSYERYNSVRASFSFGHAIALGVYCVAMLPLIMYQRKRIKKPLYSVTYMIGIGCLLLTMSRGVIVIFAIVFLLQVFQLSKEERREYFRITGIMCLLGLTIMLFTPGLFSTLQDVVFGTLNAFGAKFTVSSSGGNEFAILSRMSQLTMLPQVFKTNSYLFGGGTGYIGKNTIYVYLTNSSFVARSIDIEYLSLLIDKGICGLIGTIVLYFSLIKSTWKEYKNNHDILSKAFFFSFFSIFLSYLTVAQLTTGKILWILISLYYCWIRLNYFEKKEIYQ